MSTPAHVTRELLARIADAQTSRGGFLSLTTVSPPDGSPPVERLTTFFASWVLLCLRDLETAFPGAQEIVERLRAFLRKERSEHWSYNFWSRHSREAQELPYPDDLDDTFCAAAALEGSAIDGAALAQLVLLLTMSEVREGGPYVTWIVPPDAHTLWRDVDPAVNANIGYFLSRHDVALDGLDQYVSEAIRSKSLSSPYYPSPLFTAYFLSRWVKGAAERTTLARDIEQRLDMEALNPLEKAVAGLALLHLGDGHGRVTGLVEELCALPLDQICEPWPFCIQAIKGNRRFIMGAPALSAAFVAAFFQASISQVTASQARTARVGAPQIQAVRQEIAAFVRRLSSGLRSDVWKMYEAFVARNRTHEIVLLPYWAAEAFTGGERIPSVTLARLGAANALGWMAYTVYDDILDADGGALALPAANACSREMTRIFQEIAPPDSGFAADARDVLDGMDAANRYELEHARPRVESDGLRIRDLPSPESVPSPAERSLGHALAPLAVACHLGFIVGSPEYERIKHFFVHYLEARQMSDDAHDWEEDLRRGQLNSASLALLRIWRTARPAGWPHLPFAAFDSLRELFWREVIPDFCGLIQERIRLARADLAELGMVRDPRFFEAVLKSAETAAQHALDERRQMLGFLGVFETKLPDRQGG